MARQRLAQAERREQIALAALKVLAASGPSGFTLAELGESIGVTDASILKHFASKAAVVDAAIAKFGQLLDEDLARDLDGSEEPLQRLASFFIRRLTKVRLHPEVIRLAHGDRLRDVAGPDGALKVDQHLQRSMTFIRQCVEEAQAAGQMRNETPTQLWVWLIAGAMRGAAGTVHPSPSPIAARGKSAAAALSPERTWTLLEVVLRSEAPAA